MHMIISFRFAADVLRDCVTFGEISKNDIAINPAHGITFSDFS
jgi:hypothetical protein